MLRLANFNVVTALSRFTLRGLDKTLRPTREITTRKFTTEANAQFSPTPKDIIIYKYENPRFFKMMNFFTISQLFFWGYLAHWTYYGLKDAKVDESKTNEDVSWWRKMNLGEKKYKNAFACLCLFIGYTVIFVGWTFTLKSVRYLILLKNGKDVSLVTYTPFGKNRIIDVPLRCISAQESRRTANTYLPLKVKNMTFYYILDMKGEFKNTKLFDTVVGLKRKF